MQLTNIAPLEFKAASGNLEPLVPVLKRLMKEMKHRWPHARPFDDSQPWSFAVEDSGAPGTWTCVAGLDTGGADTGFMVLPMMPVVSARAIHFTGPPRLFLAGWDVKENVLRVVSARIWTNE